MYILVSLYTAFAVYVRDNVVSERHMKREAVRATERESHVRQEETRFIRYKLVVVGFRTTSYAFPDTAYVCIHIYERVKYHCMSVLHVKRRFFDFFAR